MPRILGGHIKCTHTPHPFGTTNPDFRRPKIGSRSASADGAASDCICLKTASTHAPVSHLGDTT
jgi:hypothetical protein